MYDQKLPKISIVVIAIINNATVQGRKDDNESR